MGTNYYLKTEQGVRHIGKRSAGWKFLFEKYPWENFSIEEYVNILKSGAIFNEDNIKFTFNDFWKIVQSSQKEQEHITCGEFPVYQNISGYDFVNNSFS